MHNTVTYANKFANATQWLRIAFLALLPLLQVGHSFAAGVSPAVYAFQIDSAAFDGKTELVLALFREAPVYIKQGVPVSSYAVVAAPSLRRHADWRVVRLKSGAFVLEGRGRRVPLSSDITTHSFAPEGQSPAEYHALWMFPGDGLTKILLPAVPGYEVSQMRLAWETYPTPNRRVGDCQFGYWSLRVHDQREGQSWDRMFVARARPRPGDFVRCPMNRATRNATTLGQAMLLPQAKQVALWSPAQAGVQVAIVDVPTGKLVRATAPIAVMDTRRWLERRIELLGASDEERKRMCPGAASSNPVAELSFVGGCLVSKQLAGYQPLPDR